MHCEGAVRENQTYETATELLSTTQPSRHPDRRMASYARRPGREDDFGRRHAGVRRQGVVRVTTDERSIVVGGHVERWCRERYWEGVRPVRRRKARPSAASSA